MDEDELQKPKRTLQRRKVTVKFVEDADTQIAHVLEESRRQEGKENARKVNAVKSETPRRRSLRPSNAISSSSNDTEKLTKINEDEVLPEEFTEKHNRPSALLEDDEEPLHVGFQTPKKRKSMVLKAKESASKYSSLENGTPNKTPRLKGSENLLCTPNRRVSIGGVIGATPSKGDGTPTRSALKRRESMMSTPKACATPQALDTPRSRQKLPQPVEQTPRFLRSKQRAVIAKKAEAEAEDLTESEDDDDDDDYDGSSSDSESSKPSDDSCESSGDESAEDNVAASKTGNKSRQMPSTSQHRKSSSSASIARRGAKEEKDFEISTDLYFETQSAKPITSNNTLSRLKTPRLHHDTLLKLLEDVDAPHRDPISRLSNEFRCHADQWMFSLWEGYNILLHGLGSKRHIMQSLHQEMLADCNVLLVNGFFPGVTIKNVIDDILTDIFEVKDIPSNLLECVDLIDSIQSKKQSEPLYLLVNNLDGATFRNDRAQAVFSQLAQMPKVHLIASIDHMNAPLLWDQAKLRRFNFVWWDVTNFIAYTAETSYESSILIQQSGALALSSLNSVFKSLIPNARKVFILIAKNQLEKSKNQNFSGIAFQDLYWKCRSAFLASSDRVLRAQLTEFLDHHLLKQRRGADGVETLAIPIESVVLAQFVESQEQGECN